MSLPKICKISINFRVPRPLGGLPLLEQGDEALDGLLVLRGLLRAHRREHGLLLLHQVSLAGGRLFFFGGA